MNDPEPTTSIPRTTRRPWRAVWLPVGGLLTVVALVVGSLGVVSAWAVVQGTSTETDSSTTSYPRPAARLDLEVDFGATHVTGADVERVEVRRELTWSGTEPTIDETWAGDRLRVDTECPNSFPHWVNQGCSIDYTAQLPRAAAADVRTTTGTIDVRSLDGELTLTSTTGEISVDDVAGPLSAHATTGTITGSDLSSTEVDTTVSTGATDLRFAESPDRVTVAATTGPVTIEVPSDDHPYRVEVQTTTGEQRVDVAQDPRAARLIDVRTTTADVHIRYAS